MTDHEQLLAHFSAVRAHSLSLAAPLSEEDCCAQSMPDASPVKWHLAHTTWFFETFILARFEPDYAAFHPLFRMLFNSYYNGVGDKHARAQRGLLTRPSFAQVLAYRQHVDARVQQLCTQLDPHDSASDECAALLALGLQHEQQHQELILTDLQHLLSMNPLMPAYQVVSQPDCMVANRTDTIDWLSYDAGIVEIGHAGNGFCFDNETPRHRQFVEAFSLATHLVSNGEFLAFIKDGGYRHPAFWLSEGWDWVQAHEWQQPMYWQQSGPGEWHEFTLHGLQPLALHQAATHLSYFEADAYARWAGARLPTEAEWECAAKWQDTDPAPVPTLQQLFDRAWQWTSSSYTPYPGYETAAGALGEYNGKFMVNQYVLRGSSSATSEGHSRTTYRNFFPASARWQCSGIRLAKSLK